MPANIQSTGAVAAGAVSDPITLPYQSYLNLTFQLWVSAGTATAAVQGSLDGTNWTALTSVSSTSTLTSNVGGTIFTFIGPLRMVRLSVSGTGNGFMNVAWGDNK